MDSIETVTLNNVVVQANGIIRNSKGRLIARLVSDVDFGGEHIKQLEEKRIAPWNDPNIKWICEQHPTEDFEHKVGFFFPGVCPGPGMPAERDDNL